MTDEQTGLDPAILNVGLNLAMEWGPEGGASDRR